MKLKSIPIWKWLVVAGLVLLAVLSVVVKPARLLIKDLNFRADMYDAIKARNASNVGKLLKAGADPNREGAGGLMGGTPLRWATWNSDLKIMKILIKGGADVNLQVNYGQTALMDAQTPEAAQLLLDAGADPNLKNDSGQTALDCANVNHFPRVAEVIKRSQAER